MRDEDCSFEIETYVLGDDGVFPNNAKLPLLVYRNALDVSRPDAASEVQQLFARNHWGSSWVDGVYGFHHYHSTAHEVLGVVAGEANVQFGGENGVAASVSAGDAVVIPAGVAHKKFTSSADFTVVGAYPQGQRPDMCYGKPDERPATDENITHIPSPKSDPIAGPTGPLMKVWKA